MISFPNLRGAGSGYPGRGNHQPVPDGPGEHPWARCHPGALPSDLLCLEMLNIHHFNIPIFKSKIMRQLRLISMLIFLFGCVEEEVTPIIRVKTAESELNELLSDPKGGVATLEFSINVPWSITIDYCNTSIGMVKDWLIISKTSGDAGDIMINLQVIENFIYDKRSATINIKTASIVKRMKITQNQRLGMILSKTEVVLEYYEQVFTIDVNHNVDYNFEILDDWITYIETKSLDKKTESFSIPENTIREKRVGCIVFMSKDKMFRDTVQVIQNPKSQRQFYIDLLCNGRWRGAQRRIMGLNVPDNEWDILNSIYSKGWYDRNYIFTTDNNYRLLECYAFDSIFFMHGPFNYKIESSGDSSLMMFRTGAFFDSDKQSLDEWYSIQHLSDDSLVLYNVNRWVSSTGDGGKLPTIWKYEHQDRDNKSEYFWENDTTTSTYKILTNPNGWSLDSVYCGRSYDKMVKIEEDPYTVTYKKDSVIYQFSDRRSYYGRWYLLGTRIKLTGTNSITTILHIDDSTLVTYVDQNREENGIIWWKYRTYFSKNK